MGYVIEPHGVDIKSDDSLTILSRQAASSAKWTESDTRYLLDKVDQLKDATVKQALDAVKVRAASFDGSELSQPEIGKGKAGPGRGD